MGNLERSIQRFGALEKRNSVVDEVKLNLELYSSLLFYAPEVWDMVKSHSGSLITIENDKDGNYIGNSVGAQVGKAIDQQQENSDFIEKYNRIISALSDTHRHIILKRHVENIPVYQLERGDIYTASDKRAYSKLNDAYLIIAILDNNIDFTVSDYVEIRSMQKQKKCRYTRIKEESYLFLFDYFENVESDFIDKRIAECLSVIPERERNKLVEFIKGGIREPTKNEYRLIARGVITFAYLYDEVNLSRKEFNEIIHDSQRGIKKYLNGLFTNISKLSMSNILNINIQNIYVEKFGDKSNEYCLE